MNTDKLLKMYDLLAPAERVPLILASRQRGDVAEENRLVRSAPVRHLRQPDFFEYESRLTELALRYLAQQLKLIYLFNQLASPSEVPHDGEPLPNAASVVAYQFITNAEGWSEFCRCINIDPDSLTAELPGHDIVEQHVQWLTIVACDHAAATAFLCESSPDRSPVAESGEIAGKLQTILASTN